jgi:hypothetical protein
LFAITMPTLHRPSLLSHPTIDAWRRRAREASALAMRGVALNRGKRYFEMSFARQLGGKFRLDGAPSIPARKAAGTMSKIIAAAQ